MIGQGCYCTIIIVLGRVPWLPFSYLKDMPGVSTVN